MVKARRHKVQCCECNAIFNNDYKIQHENNIHNGKKIYVRNLGAPASPFEAAAAGAKKRKIEETRLTETITKLDYGMKLAEKSSDYKDTVCQPSQSSELDFSYQNNEYCEKNDKDCNSHNYTIFGTENIGADKNIAVSCSDQSCELSSSTNISSEKEINGDAPIEENSSEDYSTLTWTKIMGQVKFLLHKCSDTNELFQNISKQEIISEKLTVMSLMDYIRPIKENCEKILEKCEIFLKKQNIETIVAGEVTVSRDHLVSHDPGLRPTELTDNQKNYLIKLGPHQPVLASFPSDGKDRFNPHWYKQFHYLEYSTVKDCVFCFVCFLFPDGVGQEKSEDAWSKTGVRNWGKMRSAGKQKLGKLQTHFSSNAHKSALEKYCNFLLKEHHIDVLLDKTKRLALVENEKMRLQNREVVRILLDTCRTLGCQGLAFQGSESDDGNFTQIVSLISRYNSTLKKWFDDRALRPYHVTYMSPDSQNEFISLIANEIEKTIITEINSCDFFSVMADTTPDSSNKDMLSIVIRTVDENCKPRERLLNISECIDKTGIGMAKHIFETLLKKEINTSSLAFQCYDFASSMSGQFNGVQQKLSEIIGQQVPYIPCQDHRTNTAVEHSCRVSIVIRDLYDTLEALYVFFNSSTKRFRQLKNKIKEVENALLLKNLSKTRWTARAETIKAVNISFEPILSLLGEISTQKELDCVTKTKAYGLYKKMKSFDFIVSLFFMKNIMNKMKILTETLETPNLNLIDGITVIESTVTILEQINTNSTDMDNLIGSAENFALTLNIDPEQDFQLHHRRRLRPKKIDECTENEVTLDLKLFYRKEFKAVLDTLCNGLRDNVNAIKTSISPLYSIFCFPLNKNNLTSEAIQKAVTMFPPNSRPDMCALQSELEVFFQICKEKEIMSMDALTNVVIQYKKALKLTFSMCQLIITAGYGVSANERAFSQLKIVKGVLRTTMADERLNNLMLMKCEGDLLDISNLENVIDRWSSLKQRRIHV